MEPRSGNIFQPTRQTSQSSFRSCFCFQCCAVSPPQLFPSLTKYVRCPPLPAPIVHPIKKVGAVSPPPNVVLCLCHTRLGLGFYVRTYEHTFMCGVPTPVNVVLCLGLSTLILGFSWNINLTQLVSSSVALPAAQLVTTIIIIRWNNYNTATTRFNHQKIIKYSQLSLYSASRSSTNMSSRSSLWEELTQEDVKSPVSELEERLWFPFLFCITKYIMNDN